MDGVSLGFSALAIVSILAVTVLLAFVGKRVAPGDWARTVLVAGTGGAIVILACSIELIVLPLLLVGPLAALGALFATLATSLMETESVPKRLVVGGAATAIVFLPVASTVFATLFDPFGTRLGVIDLGERCPPLSLVVVLRSAPHWSVGLRMPCSHPVQGAGRPWCPQFLSGSPESAGWSASNSRQTTWCRSSW